MSDDEAQPDLVALLYERLYGKSNLDEDPLTSVLKDPLTGVLEDAEYVCNKSIDVNLEWQPTKKAAASIYAQMQRKGYSAAKWSEAELHPKAKDEGTVAFIFTMDLLNFCFWSSRPDAERFAVEYRGKRWTGYSSLVASLQRALDEGIPITDSHFWQDEEECTLDVLKQVFRSCTDEEMPLLEDRLACLREAGKVLYEEYQCSAVNLIAAANGSAAVLVRLLARGFKSFRDVHYVEGRKNPIRFLKRAQIFVADIWACFEGQGYGAFRDIDKITMFADYRVPQILNTMGCIRYSPPLDWTIRDKKLLKSGERREMEIRGCSIWCVELIRRMIMKEHPDAKINAILIDFFLYDTMKEMEAAGEESIPHHRTRSIWY